MECGEHSKKPTNKTKTEPTEISDDSKEPRVVPDIIHYVEMDEE